MESIFTKRRKNIDIKAFRGKLLKFRFIFTLLFCRWINNMLRIFSKNLMFILIFLTSHSLVAMDTLKSSVNALPNATQVRDMVLDLMKIVHNLSECNGINSQELHIIEQVIQKVTTDIQNLGQSNTEMTKEIHLLAKKLDFFTTKIDSYDNIFKKSLIVAAIVAGSYGAWKLGWWIKAKLDAQKTKNRVRSGKIT